MNSPRIGSLFSGYGGLDMAVQAVHGGSTAWHCEVDKHASALLAARHPDVPNHGDITAVDWAAVEAVDILTGGFPCQDVSHAGKRAGVRPGTRSGLWVHMAWAIEQLRPRLVVIENVSGLLSAGAHSDMEPCAWCVGDDGGEPALRALGAVLGDLADLGYDAAWGSVRASDAGAPHRRERVFIVARPADTGSGQQPGAAEQGRLPVSAEHGAGAVTLLPTPKATNNENRQSLDRYGPNLGMALLPTPKGSDGPNGGPGMRNGRGGIDALPAISALLATPTAGLGQGGGQRSHRFTSGSTSQRTHNPAELAEDWDGSFGPYDAAVQRWETITGTPAPPPTIERGGRARLNPGFVEWMMGIPPGWVTGLGLPASQQLKLLGNGVVPQQAALALTLLDGAA